MFHFIAPSPIDAGAFKHIPEKYGKDRSAITPDVELHNTPRNRGLTYVFHGAVEVTTDGATTTVKFK